MNIIKYNKKILERINITQEDFKVYIYVKDSNKKYNLNIEDIDISELTLKDKHLGNEGLKSLSKIIFKELKFLDLRSNNISDINCLEKFDCKKLEILKLNFNEISDINSLEKVNFKELRELYLINNNIKDMYYLELILIIWKY